MASTIISNTAIPEVVSADQAFTDYLPASQLGDSDPAQWDIVVKMKTNTPGTGTLLATIRYFDGEVLQDLNTALALTAGAYAIVSWPDILRDASQPIQVSYTFLSGVVDGVADVMVFVRYS